MELGASVSIPRGFLDASILYKYYIVYEDKREVEECIYNASINTRYLIVLSSELKKMGDGMFNVQQKMRTIFWTGMCYFYMNMKPTYFE